MNHDLPITDYGIEMLQQALPTVRMLAGWTVEDLSTLLGVTRPTTYKIEHGLHKMTRRDAFAILYLIEYKIRLDALTGNDDLLYCIKWIVYPYLHREKPLDISNEKEREELDKFNDVLYQTSLILNKFSKGDTDLINKRRNMMRKCIHDIYIDKVGC